MDFLFVQDALLKWKWKPKILSYINLVKPIKETVADRHERLVVEAGNTILHECGILLAKIDNRESGPLLETIVQLLNHESFKSLIYILKMEKSSYITQFSVSLALKIAQKANVIS